MCRARNFRSIHPKFENNSGDLDDSKIMAKKSYMDWWRELTIRGCRLCLRGCAALAIIIVSSFDPAMLAQHLAAMYISSTIKNRMHHRRTARCVSVCALYNVSKVKNNDLKKTTHMCTVHHNTHVKQVNKIASSLWSCTWNELERNKK